MQTARKLTHEPNKKQVKNSLRLITNKRKRSISVGIVIVIVAALPATVMFNSVQRTLVTQNAIEIENLREILQEEQAYNQKLKVNVTRLKSPERIQEIALGKLGMIVPATVNYIKVANENISQDKLAMSKKYFENYKD